MTIKGTVLTNSIVTTLMGDGVGEVEAKRAADQFVGTLKRDHPDWFEQPRIDVADFLAQRYGGPAGNTSWTE